MRARSPCLRLPAPRRCCRCSVASRMRGRAERGVRGNARADGASPFSPQVRTREDDTIFPRTAKVASNRASGVSAEARGGRARFDRRACWVLSDGSEIFPSSERLDVLRSSRGLGPDKRVPYRFLPCDPTRQPRSRSCAPWVWRARRSARATRARSPRGSGARGATARAHPAPAAARPAAATPPVPSHRRTPRSSGRTTTPP